MVPLSILYEFGSDVTYLLEPLEVSNPPLNFPDVVIHNP